MTMTINVAIPPNSADTGQSAGARRRRQQSLALRSEKAEHTHFRHQLMYSQRA